jgi:hypothetical protein
MTKGAVLEDFFPAVEGPQPKRRRLNQVANSDETFQPASTESTVGAAADIDEVDQLRRVATQLPTRWKPRHEYKSVYIGELKSGSQRVAFTARVVNIYEQRNLATDAGLSGGGGGGGKTAKGRSPNSSGASAARGSFKILAKDDSGCILVSSSVLQIC